MSTMPLGVNRTLVDAAKCFMVCALCIRTIVGACNSQCEISLRVTGWFFSIQSTKRCTQKSRILFGDPTVVICLLAMGRDGTMPRKGSKCINVSLVKKKGNKNITCVDNLENFGIIMDEPLKRAVSRHFSVSVSYAGGPDVSKGTLMFVQGKYVVQLVEFLSKNLQIPKKHFVGNAKGVSKRDKAVNV
eukprot:m.46229 g.46229  ORF g.46229 m.46229 type:complete len:188 (-) comp15154_c0_seq6:196-759(-)